VGLLANACRFFGSCAVVRGFISPEVQFYGVQFFGGLMAVGSDGGKDDVFLRTSTSVWIYNVS